MSSSTDSVTSSESVSIRVKRKFVHKWIIRDFPCEKIKGGEVLPSIKFNFNYSPEAQFIGKLSLHGELCYLRKCRFILQSETLDKWKVRVKLSVGEYQQEAQTFYLSENEDTVSFMLVNTEKTCLLKKCCRNNSYIINCEVFYVTYIEKKDQPCEIIKDDDIEAENNFGMSLVVAEHDDEMFADNAEEDKSQNKVNINNIDSEVFQVILHYMYTGKVKNLNKLAYELLDACYIYDLPELKKMCIKELAINHMTKTEEKTFILYANCKN